MNKKLKEFEERRQRTVDGAWADAQRLEAEGRFEEAEQLLLKAIDSLFAYSQIAHMYELRMRRCKEQGDMEGAIDAYHRSADAMWSMASGATSGGEGAALSYQSEQHVESLRNALGFDPGPRKKDR